jgi:hypothetical protein
MSDTEVMPDNADEGGAKRSESSRESHGSGNFDRTPSYESLMSNSCAYSDWSGTSAKSN